MTRMMMAGGGDTGYDDDLITLPRSGLASHPVEQPDSDGGPRILPDAQDVWANCHARPGIYIYVLLKEAFYPIPPSLCC